MHLSFILFLYISNEVLNCMYCEGLLIVIHYMQMLLNMNGQGLCIDLLVEFSI